MLPTGVEADPQPTREAGPHLRTHRVWTPLARALAATGDHWTLMIVHALEPGRMRLTRLQRRLPGVSTGVLERYVQQMVALGLVTRSRFKEMPPRVELELTDAGRELLPVAGALARWGMRHRWSSPAEREQVDVGALLRMLPALLEVPAGLPEGSVEAIITGAEAPTRHLYRVEEGRLRLVGGGEDATVDPPEDPATASVRGAAEAWIAALGPAGDYRRLSFAGDERLAKLVLDALPQ